jgi:methionyl-tRNA formyltransferase
LCGKNDAAADALEFLVERGDDLWALGTVGDRGVDGWQRSLVATAKRLGVRCEQPARINAPAFVARLADYGADALLSIQYDQILRGTLFRTIGCPCLNFHFALLPRHRGVSPIAFAVLMGDSEAGVTLHEMVEDIDAGDILSQRAVPIRPSDTAREVYDRVSEAAVGLFRDSYPFDANRLPNSISQDDRVASYHRRGDFDFAARAVDWNRPAEELHRWLRAMIFPPLQFPETRLGDRRLRIERIAGDVGAPVAFPPGAVVARSDGGLDVAAVDGTIRIVTLSDVEAGSGGTSEPILAGDRFQTEGRRHEDGGMRG